MVKGFCHRVSTEINGISLNPKFPKMPTILTLNCNFEITHGTLDNYENGTDHGAGIAPN